MSQVIVIASGKGGTGKTTVCTCLAVALADKNKKVLVIDTDSGMRGADLVLGLTDVVVYDLSDVVSGACALSYAIYKVEGYNNLDMLAAPIKADDEISPAIMKHLIEKIKNEYDYILVDSPAGTGSGFEAAATACDSAIVVVNAEPISIRGGQNIVERLNSFGIKNSRLIINRFDKKRFYTLDNYKDLDEIIDKVGIRLLGLVPEDVSIVSLSQHGALTKGYSQTKVIFDSIAERVEGIDVPLAVKV